MFGICNLSIVPCRAEPSGKSEMVTQLLMGEHFTVLEEQEEWSKIKIAHDNYECWINNKQYVNIREQRFDQLSSGPVHRVNELFSIVSEKESSNSMPVVMGTVLPGFNNGDFKLEENKLYHYDGAVAYKAISDAGNIAQTALMFLNAPYLWGGRTCWGIDCSGLTQIAFSLNGIQLPRDAYQQAELGTPLSFVEEAQVGDLAFFDNEEGNITHVGIILNDNQIIHASGRVRIDKIDHYGIFHSDRKKYSHLLRVIKRVL